ncbi:hypothetical protein PQQ51_31565 [Paraburkholderia xenovorans]|uniref:hypothetical protein n=1 Tax=Paraburkholderia xenovorans TaxID=36873 RepID=UPI0038B8B696
MTNKELLLLALVVYVGYRYQRSHSGTSAIDSVYAREASQFATMDGTNFTRSVWDSTSGQPGYMWGTVPAQGGLSTQAIPMQLTGNVFGHM